MGCVTVTWTTKLLQSTQCTHSRKINGKESREWMMMMMMIVGALTFKNGTSFQNNKRLTINLSTIYTLNASLINRHNKNTYLKISV